jgi:hypothetical protein
VTFAASAEPDFFARWVAIAALVVSVGHLLLNYLVWNRSGGRLKMTASKVEHSQDRLRDEIAVEVRNVGRMPVVVRQLELRDAIPTENQSGGTRSYLGLVMKTAERLPHTLQPGEWMESRVTFLEIAARWSGDLTLTVHAWAFTGDGRARASKPLRIHTPRLDLKG